MKWVVDDEEGSYDRVTIREAEPSPGWPRGRRIAYVMTPAPTLSEPTDADREAMLATARDIVERHEAVTVAEEQFAVIARRAESYKAALGMIAQLLSYRVPHMIAQAALDGADCADEETAINVCEGKWRKPF